MNFPQTPFFYFYLIGAKLLASVNKSKIKEGGSGEFIPPMLFLGAIHG
jgi:hypothetical protein